MLIDQNSKVKQLIERLHDMSGLNLIGKTTIYKGHEVELTKLVIYDLR